MSEQTHSPEDKSSKAIPFWTTVGQDLKRVLILVGLFAGVVAAIYGVIEFVDARIESRITDPTFIQNLAAHLRASAIFDENESVLADMGAMQYIEQIDVERADDGAFTIRVSPTEFLGVQPILESLDGNFVIHAERGPKYDWIFELRGVQAIVTEGSAIPETFRFRIELLR